jgi:hypothetical protein
LYCECQAEDGTVLLLGLESQTVLGNYTGDDSAVGMGANGVTTTGALALNEDIVVVVGTSGMASVWGKGSPTQT